MTARNPQQGQSSNRQERFQTWTSQRQNARPTTTRGTRTTTPRAENHYEILQGDDLDVDDISNTEEMYVLRSRIVGKQPIPRKSSDNKSVLQVKVVSEGKPDKYCAALLDTGATQRIIYKRLAEANQVLPEKKRITWTTRAGVFTTDTMARIDFHFMELNSRQKINAVFHVDNTAKDKGYEMIIGLDLMEMIGLNLLVSSRTITWGDFAYTKNKTADEKQESRIAKVMAITKDEDELTPALRKALSQQGTAMVPSVYDKHDYVSMVKKCEHLDAHQQGVLLDLFKKHAETFSGRVGTFPGPPHHIKLKRDALPYSARPY
ncbi:MAG: hypothetical protein ACREOZ_05020, partial [Gloeomargaritales cyanobacterium]